MFVNLTLCLSLACMCLAVGTITKDLKLNMFDILSLTQISELNFCLMMMMMFLINKTGLS